MKLIKYQLYHNQVDLTQADGKIFSLYLNEWSGKILYRYKIDSISKVRHPGICLGYDETGKWYYMHNHYENGHPIVDTHEGFSKGNELFLSNRQSQYETLMILQNGLNEILQARSYDSLTYNCQTFVNKVSFNENKSEAVENWIGGIFAGLLIVIGIKAFNNSR